MASDVWGSGTWLACAGQRKMGGPVTSAAVAMCALRHLLASGTKPLICLVGATLESWQQMSAWSALLQCDRHQADSRSPHLLLAADTSEFLVGKIIDQAFQGSVLESFISAPHHSSLPSCVYLNIHHRKHSVQPHLPRSGVTKAVLLTVKYAFVNGYSLDLEFPKSHILNTWFPVWSCWKVVELLTGHQGHCPQKELWDAGVFLWVLFASWSWGEWFWPIMYSHHNVLLQPKYQGQPIMDWNL